ncbi:hypothetical protein G1K95_10325, partial [Tenacibaculum finnmarkense]|nr:hypothetical protein [Tenacibaculum finnmarkense]
MRAKINNFGLAGAAKPKQLQKQQSKGAGNWQGELVKGLFETLKPVLDVAVQGLVEH